MTRLLGITILSGLLMAGGRAEDWPQWGGPNRDHVSRESGLMQKWPAGGPKQVWVNKEAGMGYAGVAVSKGKLFTMGGRNLKEFLIALDANSGKELWATELSGILENDWGDGPRGTPTVVGDQVFALSGDGTLIRANVADGKIAWKKTMRQLGGSVPNWGYTESVLVENGTVYCTPGGSKGAIAALDANNGQVRWQSKDFTEGAQYASIVPADINNVRQLIQITMLKYAGINAKDGSTLWTADFPGRVAVIPTPIVTNNLVYVTAGYGIGCELARIGPNNKVEMVYENNKVMKNHHGGVVLLGGHIYGHSEPNGWVCQNLMSGEEVWISKDFGKGAVTYAGGRLYCLEERSGTVALVEPTTQGRREHGRMTLQPQAANRPPKGRIWMHPVIANGKLYLRDQEVLACYDVAGK